MSYAYKTFSEKSFLPGKYQNEELLVAWIIRILDYSEH